MKERDSFFFLCQNNECNVNCLMMLKKEKGDDDGEYLRIHSGKQL